jgi:hypothetical protein
MLPVSLDCVCLVYLSQNKHNPEKLATYGTPDVEKLSKHNPEKLAT